MMTITPSLVRRLPASRIRRIATSFGSEGECRASKRSCTADDTLLTFCPPGPDERTKDSVSSDSSIEMVEVIWIIVALNRPHGEERCEAARLEHRKSAVADLRTTNANVA